MVEFGHFGRSVGINLSKDLFRIFDGPKSSNPKVMQTLMTDLGRGVSERINAEGNASMVLELAKRRLQNMKYFNILVRGSISFMAGFAAP